MGLAKITESTVKRERATALESIKSDERAERVESTIYAERARPFEGTTSDERSKLTESTMEDERQPGEPRAPWKASEPCNWESTKGRE